MPFQVSIRVPPFAPVPEVTAFTQRCEEAGFDGVGYVDSQMIGRDVFVVLGHAAAATSRVRLMPAVTNPMTRHVSVIASAARSVWDVAPGRSEIWIGRGFSSANLVGLPYGSVRRMRETVRDYRRLLAGEWDVFPGVHTHMAPGDGTRVPIIVAASGPKTMRLAGETADGLLLSTGNGNAALERARDLALDGARAAGRDRSDIRLIVCLPTAIRPDREEAYARAAPMCAHRLRDGAWLAERGIDGRGLQPPAELSELYPDFFHAEDWDRAVELSSFVPPDLRAQMCGEIGLIGSPQDCLRRLEELRDMGFDEVFMQTIGTMNFPEAEMRAFGEVIGPGLRAGVAAR
ncbi:MAG: LLM class flavin-dependent oxidoreductase [Dehalococcoidia bacterium]